jgi:hypothetical protein
MSDDNRLGGGKRIPIHRLEPVSRLHINRLHSMVEAVGLSRRQVFKEDTDDDRAFRAAVGNVPVDGNKERLAAAIATSDRMIEDAIALDPRLAKKAQWLRRDEGEHVDSGLLAEGDDQPFYKRIKAVVNEETQAGEPFHICLSTDDDTIVPGTAASIIATIRLVQQFIPVYVWWQGAWLTESKWQGFVSHVPLVQGDMDFSRLEFCIADPMRDHFSFCCMTAHCVLDLKESWTKLSCGYRADRSYLPESQQSPFKHFVTHTGISPDPKQIAGMAASWLGWDSLWDIECAQYNTDRSALQAVPEKAGTPYVDRRTAAEKRQEEADNNRRWKEDRQRKEQEAKERMTK